MMVRAVLEIGFLLLLSFTCTHDLTGGIGHEGEARICGKVVYDSSGTVPEGAGVFLRAADFVRDEPDTGDERHPDALVDEEGGFEIDSVPKGRYRIEVNDGRSNGASIDVEVRQQSLEINLTTDTLRPTGTVQGKLVFRPENPEPVFVQIYGLDRSALLDEKTDSFTITDVPRGDYTLRVAGKGGREPAKNIDVRVESGAITRIRYDESIDSVEYMTRKVWFNTTASGAGVGRLKNFPVLVRLHKDNFDFSTARRDGSDIRFVKSDGEPLPFEIERWSRDIPAAEIWVRIDTLRGDDSTQFILLQWSGSPGKSAADGTAVFDTSCGYQGVWHLGEARGDTARDATINGFYGIPYGMDGTSTTSGLIGFGQRFNDSSTYIAMPGTADGKLNFPENGYFTLSAWVMVDTLDGDFHAIVTKSNQLYGITVNEDDNWEFFEFEQERSWMSNQFPGQAGSWKYIAGISAGERQYLYVDGQCVDSQAVPIGDKKYRVTTDPVTIGKRTSASAEGWFSGLIDEVRIANTARSADWVRCCYMNQKTDDALVRIGE